MNRRKDILLGMIGLLLLGYGAWATTRISELQVRLVQLEASHRALSRYTYDFGAALTQPSKFCGLSGSEMAKVVLLEMRQDELTRPAVESSRTRQVLIGDRLSPHNSVEKVRQ